MPRNVNAKALLDTRQTTTCWLLRIDPRGGAAFGLTDTNVDSTVDDGQGPVTYIAAYGYDSAAVSATGGQGVDNSEAQALFAPLADFGITVDMVDSGYLDGAKFHQYQYDYVAGEIIALVHFGFLGEVRYRDSQLVIPDLASLSVIAKQKAVCENGSKTCRAIYGDATTGCPATLVWNAASVDAIGIDEPDRVFQTTAPITVPGVIHWLTGLNAGKYSVVESVDSDGVVGLKYHTPYLIADTDTFEWRIDCNKTWTTCKLLLGSAAPGAFRGEPFRLESIGDALQTPGATTR